MHRKTISTSVFRFLPAPRTASVTILESRRLLSGEALANATATVIDQQPAIVAELVSLAKGETLAPAQAGDSLSGAFTKSTLPSSVVLGVNDRGTITITLTNQSGATVKSVPTVRLYVSSDGAVDSDATLIGTIKHPAALRAGKSVVLRDTIRSLPSSLSGSYTLLAQFTDPTSGSAVTVSGPAISVSPATISYADTLVSGTLPTVSGKRKIDGVAEVKITNNGNVVSKGRTTIQVYASPNGAVSDGTLLKSEALSLLLKPGASKTIKIVLTTTPTGLSSSDAIVAQVTDPKSDVTSTGGGGGGGGQTTNNSGLVNFSVGDDGTVWGLDSAGHPYAYQPSSGALVSESSSTFTSLAVGSASAIWALDDGAVYHWNSTSAAFVSVSGSLTQIATGIDGDTWGLDSSGDIFHYIASSNSFAQVSGTLSSIYVGNTGSVYGLSSAGAVLWYNPGTATFQQLTTTSGFTSLSVGSDGTLWGLQGTTASYYNVLTDSFDATAGSFSVLENGAGPSAYALDDSGNLYHFAPSTMTWTAENAAFSKLAVGGDGSVWGLNSSGAVTKLAGVATIPANTLVPVTGTLDQISVGVDGSAWGIDNGVFFFNYMTQSFQQVPGAPNLRQLSVADRGNVWGVDSSGNVYHYDADTQTWISVAGNLSLVEAGANGAVWGLGGASTSGAEGSSIFQYTGGTFQEVDAGSLLFAGLDVGADGSTWGASEGFPNYGVYQSTSSSFTQVGGVGGTTLIEGLSVGSAQNVWAVTSSGQVYHFDPTTQQFVSASGSLSTIWATFDGGAWGVDVNGKIYQWNASTQTFNTIAGSATYVVLGNDASVWAPNEETGVIQRWF